MKNSAVANLELLTAERNQDVRGKAEGERASFSIKMHIGCDPAHMCVCASLLFWGLWSEAAPCVSRKLHERTCDDV